MKLLLFVLLSTFTFASGSMHNHSMMKKGPKHPIVYNNYKLTNKAKKEATAVYLDTCGDELWKQDASKVKACPYCGPAMPNCGKLVKIIPKRGVKYDWSDYDLPNKVCPVSGEAIENTKHSIEVDGHEVLVCCKHCIKKFKKALKKGKEKKYLKKLALNPEKFGFVNAKKVQKHKHDGHSGHKH
ncbi:MAG: hypothetical protein COB02_11470 [Candidatus Cloacimonadota bacterium]|nr:MAG: hypothetical protein COB02_11470 [Candidatus Cloacimonadota bacterium]